MRLRGHLHLGAVVALAVLDHQLGGVDAARARARQPLAQILARLDAVKVDLEHPVVLLPLRPQK